MPSRLHNSKWFSCSPFGSPDSYITSALMLCRQSNDATSNLSPSWPGSYEMTYTSQRLGLQKPNDRCSFRSVFTDWAWNTASATRIFSSEICTATAQTLSLLGFGGENCDITLSYLS